MDIRKKKLLRRGRGVCLLGAITSKPLCTTARNAAGTQTTALPGCPHVYPRTHARARTAVRASARPCNFVCVPNKMSTVFFFFFGFPPRRQHFFTLQNTPVVAYDFGQKTLPRPGLLNCLSLSLPPSLYSPLNLFLCLCLSAGLPVYLPLFYLTNPAVWFRDQLIAVSAFSGVEVAKKKHFFYRVLRQTLGIRLPPPPPLRRP